MTRAPLLELMKESSRRRGIQRPRRTAGVYPRSQGWFKSGLVQLMEASWPRSPKAEHWRPLTKPAAIALWRLQFD